MNKLLAQLINCRSEIDQLIAKRDFLKMNNVAGSFTSLISNYDFSIMVNKQREQSIVRFLNFLS
jgi:hypothetical protein